MAAQYVPTSYTAPVQDAGDAAFWGTLIQPGAGYAPSELFPRFTDALFFYLDEHAEPKHTGHIEPAKVVFWIKATRGNTMDPNAYDVDMYNRVAFGVWQIPFRAVVARPGNPQGGKEIAVLDRYGFMMYMLANVRADPDVTSAAFRASIANFGLVDPLTTRPFPGMPRSALPAAVDAEAAQLEAVVMQKYKAQSEQLLAAARARAELQARGRANALALIDGGTWVYR